MNLALFFDTETQGLPLFDQPSEDPRQPHIVQLGACLVDLDDYTIHSSLDLIIRPEGWTIPDDVAAIHGITTERATAVGVSEGMAVAMLMEMWDRSILRVGHNEQFDARILRIALMRFEDVDTADEWKAGSAQCTQRLATAILKLPPTDKMRAAGRFHHKSANLSEAYKHFTGNDLVGAHSAMVDVLACLEVYKAIKLLQQPEGAVA